MRIRKFVSVALCAITVSGVLTGCESVDISSIPPLSLAEVAGSRLVNLSNEEKESIVYKYVTDRIIVNNENLIGVSDKDSKAINSLFSRVNEYLKGKNNNALPEEYANYLLTEFAKTPYEWEQYKVDTIGFDPAARLYFIDVSYKTTPTIKKAVADSKIVHGEPMEELLNQRRYNQYTAYLSAKMQGNPNAPTMLAQFENAWGTVQSIMNSQAGVSLLERTRQISNDSGGIGKLTYSGLVSEPKMNTSATMTIRYVLKYNFNLGEETDLAVESLYLKNYELDNYENILSSYVLHDATGIEVLKPFIDQVVNSYHKAVEESNDVGLYQLFYDYAKLDKYYEDLNKYSLISSGNYDYEILSRSGTNVNVKVRRANKTRARGSEISLPSYDETLIMNLVLCDDDTIRIKSIHPVHIELVGEPLSVIRNVTGISDIIQYSDTSFTESNKQKIEDTIKEFSAILMKGNFEDEKFYDIVDLGVSKSTIKRMMETMNSIKADRKTTWVIKYDTKTNVYASLTLREIYETGSNNFDTEAVIDLVNRDGEWKVVDYVRTLNVKTGKSDIDSKGALCQDVK